MFKVMQDNSHSRNTSEHQENYNQIVTGAIIIIFFVFWRVSALWIISYHLFKYLFSWDFFQNLILYDFLFVLFVST